MRDGWEASENFQSLSNMSLLKSFITQVLFYDNVIIVKNCKSRKPWILMNTQTEVSRECLVYRWRGTEVEREKYYLPFSSRLHRWNKALARETQLHKPEKSWRIFVFPENCSYEGFSPTTWPAPRWPDNLVGRVVMRSIFFSKSIFATAVRLIRNCQ